MTGSSHNPPPDRLSQAEFRSLLSLLGSEATGRQLERWRNEGLLPKAIQSTAYGPDGRPAGSTVEHPRSAAMQVIAIERTVAEVRSIDRAGAILWTAGYEVDERHWRPALAQADDVGRLVGRWGRHLLNGNLSGQTFGERFVTMQNLNGILHTVARKAGKPGLARVIDMSVEVAAGEFSGFGLPASDRDESDQALAERAFGFDVGAGDHIHGKRLELGADLPTILEAMSARFPLEDFTDREIAMARDDARNALKIAHCLYASTDWIYGRGAFGLHLTRGVIRFFPLTLIQAFALGFARLRRRSNTLLPSNEIAELATEAERIWLMSMWLRDVYEQGGEGAKTNNPTRWKAVLSNPDRDSVSRRNLLGELASHEFAKREFRPWDQWRKSAGKTMSPGLLAMSIGAPETIAFDDLVGSMSDPAIR